MKKIITFIFLVFILKNNYPMLTIVIKKFVNIRSEKFNKEINGTAIEPNEKIFNENLKNLPTSRIHFLNKSLNDLKKPKEPFDSEKFSGISSEKFNTDRFLLSLNLNLNENNPINYLDIGSGDGIVTNKFFIYLKEFLKNKEINGTAIEPNEKIFNENLKNLPTSPIHFLNKSLNDLEKPEEPFDIVTIFKYCIDINNTKFFLKKLSDITSNDGVVIITLIDDYFLYSNNKLKNNENFLLNQIPYFFKVIKDNYYFQRDYYYNNYCKTPNFRYLILQKKII